MGEFEQYPVASWQVGSSPTIRFPLVDSLGETIGNRLVRQERPYRSGAKLDSTGAMPREFSCVALFNNSILEPGLEGNARPLYPFMLRELMASFATQETGNLILPTVGLVRARADKCQRVEAVTERNEARLSLTFVEDNEDALAQASLALPTVRSSIARQASQTVFSARREGTHDSYLNGLQRKSQGGTLTLTEAAAEIEGLLQAPGRSLADLETQVRASRRALQRIVRAVERDHNDGANDPRGSEFFRNVNRMLDTEASAADEKFRSRPRVKSFVIDVAVTSIFEIAARLKQNAADLLDLNGERVADPFSLERGEVIRVFETAAR